MVLVQTWVIDNNGELVDNGTVPENYLNIGAGRNARREARDYEIMLAAAIRRANA